MSLNIDVNTSYKSLLDSYSKAQYYDQILIFRLLFHKLHISELKNNESILNEIFSLTSGGNNLDVNICINVLKALCKNYDFQLESDYNLITEAFMNVFSETDNLQILELFDKCKGRSVLPPNAPRIDKWYIIINNKKFRVQYNSINVDNCSCQIDKETRTVKINNKDYPLRWDRLSNQIEYEIDEKPDEKIFCDVHKMVLNRRTNLMGYWCCNKFCYESSQEDHIEFEYNSYTLRDFIKILKLTFNEDWYYRFLGILNRLNRILPYLKCDKCKCYLRDLRSSRLAFYRVTKFHCLNENCTNYKIPIYLSHCINSNCYNIIDSRTSEKCSNGWYICNSCDVCCVHEKNLELLERYRNIGQSTLDSDFYIKLQSQVENKMAHFKIVNHKIIKNEINSSND